MSVSACAPRPLRWALVGPGRIAQRFAAAVRGLPDSRLALVIGRDAARAQAFAANWPDDLNQRPGVATSLAALAERAGEIDAVYVATPHAQHGEAVRAALEAGLPVLCEKPLVPTQAQGRALVDLAHQRQVFLMEAVWTRFLPVYQTVGSWLREQAIGELRAIQSSFCFPAAYDPRSRLFDPALAGGALLDIGIYNLTMTRWVLAQALGSCPEALAIEAGGLLAPTGVDRRVAATLRFPGGLASQFVCGVDGVAENALHIHGERGSISVPGGFWEASEALLQRGTGEPALRVQAPHRINGFEYEIEEAQRCIRAGLIESPHISHAETLATLGWMDRIRAQLGVRYPFE